MHRPIEIYEGDRSWTTAEVDALGIDTTKDLVSMKADLDAALAPLGFRVDRIGSMGRDLWAEIRKV